MPFLSALADCSLLSCIFSSHLNSYLATSRTPNKTAWIAT